MKLLNGLQARLKRNLPILGILLMASSAAFGQHEGHGGHDMSNTSTSPKDDAHAGHDMSTTPPEVDAHAGHDMSSPSQEQDPHAGHGSMAVSSSATEHAGHTMPQSQIEGRSTVMLTGVQQQFIGVRTTAAEQVSLERRIELYGRIEYDESRLYEVNTKISGYIGKLVIDKTGQYVEKGDLLFTLYSPELYQAQEELLQALETRERLGSAWDSLVEAAKRRLKLWDLTDEQIDEVARKQSLEKYVSIYAPVSGVVIHKMAFGEKRIKEGETVYRIADLSTVWLEADAYEQDLPLIYEEQEAFVTLTHYPGQQFETQVNFIYPFLESRTRTTRVRFILPSPEGLYRPGMYARVSMLSRLDPAVVVPDSAIIDLGKRKIVYVVHDAGTYFPHEVHTGLNANGRTQVLHGLEVGQQVVTSGNFLIDSESQLSASSGGGAHQH